MTTAAAKEKDHAKDQARAQLERIHQMVDGLNAAMYRDDSELAAQHDIEEAREAIEQDALSVEVRSDWCVPGSPESGAPTEYKILLCTGGPAVQIVGDLGRYCEPETARLQHQDWFKPWTDYPLSSKDEEALLTYARCFYFGE